MYREIVLEKKKLIGKYEEYSKNSVGLFHLTDIKWEVIKWDGQTQSLKHGYLVGAQLL